MTKIKNTIRPPGTLGGTFDEMKSGTWLANARHRASRRKSKWNLLLPALIIPLFLLLWAAATIGIHAIGLILGIKPLGARPSLASFLMYFPLLLPAISGACVICNFLVYRIPAARLAMEAEDRGFPGTDYATAQAALSKATWATLVAALVLAGIGISLAA
jgi:hypothetical protein